MQGPVTCTACPVTVTFVMGINYTNTEDITLYMQAIAAGCGACSATLNLTVTCASCMVDLSVINTTQTSRRLVSVLRSYKTVVMSNNCTTASQIQTKINSTAGEQAIARTMGQPATSVTVKSPPQPLS